MPFINIKSTPRILLLIFSIILMGYSQYASAQTYGLKFRSHEVILDQRTEFDLSPNRFLQFDDEFEIAFDYKIDLKKSNDFSGLFGYIFRVISSENRNVDLLITPTPDIYLNLVFGAKNSIVQLGAPTDAMENWVNLRVKFLLEEDRLIFYTPDTFYVQDKIGLKGDRMFKVIFGANDYKTFKTSDVPSICIKDIKIFENGRLKHFWPLDEEDGEVAHNRFGTQPTPVKNPVWLKKSHQSWQIELQDNLSGAALIASDTDKGVLYFLGQDELMVFQAEGGVVQKFKYKNAPEMLSTTMPAIFNPLDKKIYCYEIEGQLLTSFDPSTLEWADVKDITTEKIRSRHHNSYHCRANNSIYLFGGYGMHSYNNEIWKVDLSKKTWQMLPSDTIIFSPRYLAGLGALNDTVYILGGYGSQTGSQMVNPHSYFDLFGYAIHTGTLFKKFTIPKLYDDMCVVNNMWIDSKSRDYYALIFEKMKFEGALQLIKGNLDKAGVELMGNPIPFKFQDVKTSTGMHYFSEQKRLYTYTTFKSDSATTQIKVYSIKYPPNITVPVAEELEGKKSFAPAIVALLLVMVVTVGFVLFRAKRKKMDTEVTEQSWEENPVLESVGDVAVNPQTRSQLVLFGGFQVFSECGLDITNKFSPLLKELFLLILLHSYKNGKGISSEKLTEFLWFDKSEVSARNNRSVNIAKLKTILSEIGDTELTKKTGYWKIICLNDDIRCDYAEFLQLTSGARKLTKQNAIRLIEISKNGGFLQNSNYEWLDNFKSDVSDKIIDKLILFSEKLDVKSDAELAIQLADCIFNFDRSNEEAMVLKCKAEYWLGKHSLAKLTYEKFVKEYMVLYNEAYRTAFDEIIKS